MAKKGGKKDTPKQEEHKMLFDLRGKRRNVVKVVYAVLAVLMGLSLLLIAGPLPFGDIFGGQDAQELTEERSEERIERIEVKLKKDPGDPALLLNLTEAHLAAGDAKIQEVAPEQFAFTPDTVQEYEEAASTWDEYLKAINATDEPSNGAAQRMSNAFLQLAETSTNLRDAERNIIDAAAAQKIVAEQRPSIGSLGTLALYTAFMFDFEAAKQINEEAKKFARSKFEREQLDNQFEETEKRAKAFEQELRKEEQLQKSFSEGEGGGGAQGGGAPTNPFGLGGATLSE